jgi:hypothetical protein
MNTSGSRVCVIQVTSADIGSLAMANAQSGALVLTTGKTGGAGSAVPIQRIVHVD